MIRHSKFLGESLGIARMFFVFFHYFPLEFWRCSWVSQNGTPEKMKLTFGRVTSSTAKGLSTFTMIQKQAQLSKNMAANIVSSTKMSKCTIQRSDAHQKEAVTTMITMHTKETRSKRATKIMHAKQADYIAVYVCVSSVHWHGGESAEQRNHYPCRPLETTEPKLDFLPFVKTHNHGRWSHCGIFSTQRKLYFLPLSYRNSNLKPWNMG